MIKIAPSILSADFSRLGEEIKEAEAAGADLLHIDVMDGHFVPNITIGPQVVSDIRRVSRLPLDVHLMIKNPLKFVDQFVKAGSDMITVHIETIKNSELKALSAKLKSKGLKLGISLNPATPLSKILPCLKTVDLVLVMTVVPGFGGQAFMPEAALKIKKLRKIFSGDISVDGGINDKTAGIAVNAGANILAAGSYIFGAKDKSLAIERIRNAGDSRD